MFIQTHDLAQAKLKHKIKVKLQINKQNHKYTAHKITNNI